MLIYRNRIEATIGRGEGLYYSLVIKWNLVALLLTYRKTVCCLMNCLYQSVCCFYTV